MNKEIWEKLSKLEVGESANLVSDAGVVYQVTRIRKE